MKEFTVKQKVYLKSNNSISKINLNYTYSIIIFIILTLILSLIFKYQTYAISLIKSVIFSLIITTIITYLINILKKEYQLKTIYKDTNILSIALIIALFSTNCPYYITLIALIITIIIKNKSNKLELSAALYGILLINLYNQFISNNIVPITTDFKIIDFLINPNYLSPILSVLAFIYIFHKKSIKYNIVISYILTLFSITFLYTILNNNNINFILSFFLTNSLLFLSVYTLPDYKITPIISHSQIIYGIILGIATTIMFFFIPNLSVIIPLIIMPYIITKPLDNLSPKLKYNPKVYYLVVLLCIIIITITIIILTRYF